MSPSVDLRSESSHAATAVSSADDYLLKPALPKFVYQGEAVNKVWARTPIRTSSGSFDTLLDERSTPIELKQVDKEGHSVLTIPSVLGSALIPPQDPPSAVAPKKNRIFTIGYYGFICLSIYFLLIGLPLWDGLVVTMWNELWFTTGTFSYTGSLIFTAINFLMTFIQQLTVTFDKPRHESEVASAEEVASTALMIPCYRAAASLPETLTHALRIFPPSHIFVVDNGSTEKGTDDTENVCAMYKVNYVFVPVGSKIGAEYAGLHDPLLARFKHVMVIDDDVHLPHNLPLEVHRFEQSKGKIGCIGYTIRAVGEDGGRGTWVQQLQDLEYRSAGLMRVWGAKYGSATFPHGAIILWRKDVLLDLFRKHPGFCISEDWFFGLICRAEGLRIDFVSSVFVPTIVPSKFMDWSALFSGIWPRTPPKAVLEEETAAASSDSISPPPRAPATRGGYGEMSVFKQRLNRWSFMHIYSIPFQVKYLLFHWKMGWRELASKLSEFWNLFATCCFILLPLVLPACFAHAPAYSGVLMAINMSFRPISGIWFNLFHLHGRPEGRVSWRTVLLSTPYGLLLTLVQTAAIYRSLCLYGIFFARKVFRLPKDPRYSQEHLTRTYNGRVSPTRLSSEGDGMR